MAGTAKPNIEGLKKEANITLVSSYVRHHNGLTDIRDNISSLFDGSTSTSSTYGTVLLRIGVDNHIDFTVNGKIRIWAISTKVYTDSGGTSGKDISIKKWNGSEWENFKTSPTKSDGTWYDLTGELEEGRYKIEPLSDYVNFDEWYVENLIQNKTLILHDGEYKKWNPKVDKYNDFKLKMTSNTAPAPFVVSASSVYNASYPAWKAFDGVTEKPSTSANLWTGVANKFPYWMSINFGESKNFNYLKVYYSTNGSALARIKSCIVQGSSDGAIWEDIKSFPSVSNSNNNVTLYFQENKKSFNHYRLYMLENYGYERITLAQLVYGFKNDIDLLSIGWKDIQLSNIQTEGMDSLSPLLDHRVETLEPLPMTDKSETLQGEVGKVFSKTLNLKKYLDVKSIKVEVE